MQSVNISIAEPCHENWDAMLEAEKGKFCLSCRKQVVDFSNMTDNEVLKYISNATGSTCGRFISDQLDRTIIQRKEAHFSWKYILRFLLPAFLITNKAKAQMGIVAYTPTHTAPVSNKAKAATTINGKIIDSLSGQPVTGATVKIKGHSSGTQSDQDGNFSLPNSMALKNAELEISSIGYETKNLNINDISATGIKLVPAGVTLEPVVITTGYTTGKIRRNITGGYSVVSIKEIYKPVPLIQKITNSLSGKNNIKIYPNPVHRGSAISIDMKGMETGEYILQLVNAAGSMVMQEKIQVPVNQFNFQWQLSSGIAAGSYFIRISNAKNKLVYTGKIIAL
jgi:CarboxypepD_reg-like domain/Secretion system C-terminal sorting domain